MGAVKLSQRGRLRAFWAGTAFVTAALAWAYYESTETKIAPQIDKVVAKMPPSAEDPAARERFRKIVAQGLSYLDRNGSGSISNLNEEMDAYWDFRTFRETYLRNSRFEFSDGHPSSDLYFDPYAKAFYLNRHASDEDLSLRLASLIDRISRWVPGVDIIASPQQNSADDLRAQYARPAPG